jgi:hypothetical protein
LDGLSGGRTRWAHFEFTRINTTPTILRKKIEDHPEFWDASVVCRNPLAETMFNESRAYLLPDGRWLAYQSDESGQNQIYVQPFPDLSAGRWQVSPTGGAEPAWSRNGRELFYLDGEGALVTIPIQAQPAFSAGKPTMLFDAPYSRDRNAQVRRDARRTTVSVHQGRRDQAALSATPSLVVIQNWHEELKRLVPTN